MIDSAFVNVTDLAIRRPTRTGPGGDPAGAPTPVHTGLSAIYEPADRLFRDPDGRERQITARFFVDPTVAGSPIDVQPGDFLQWTDFAGTLVEDREIVLVNVWVNGCPEDHVELAIGNG